MKISLNDLENIITVIKQHFPSDKAGSLSIDDTISYHAPNFGECAFILKKDGHGFYIKVANSLPGGSWKYVKKVEKELLAMGYEVSINAINGANFFRPDFSFETGEELVYID